MKDEKWYCKGGEVLRWLWLANVLYRQTSLPRCLFFETIASTVEDGIYPEMLLYCMQKILARTTFVLLANGRLNIAIKARFTASAKCINHRSAIPADHLQ